jgi:D-alanyl-D-alanine carboxypeptidase (penicillin-binding protein 5/6)
MSTRKVLWEKNCNSKIGTASMAKLMTLLLFMEHLDSQNELTLESEVVVPAGVMKVPRTGVVYLVPGEKFIYSDIVKAAAIKSANDAAEMLGLCVDPDMDRFIAKMNRKAVELGMKNTRFVNAHGLTRYINKNKSDFSTSTVLDMVILAENLLEYPILMEYFSTQQASLRKVKPLIYTNTNRLINPRYPGVDGMKTGYTRAAGFCLTFSAKRNGKRIMGCVAGFKSRVDRDRFCRKLVDWAFEPDKPATAKKAVKTTQNRKKQSTRQQSNSKKR